MNILNHRLDMYPFVSTTKKGGVIVPQVIVMHYTAGWSTEGDIDTLAKSDRQASAHVVVDRLGGITQIVPFNIKAWHAGPSKYGKLFPEGLNAHSIGIEISNAGWVKQTSNHDKWVDQYGSVMSAFDYGPRQRKYAQVQIKDWHQEYHPRLAKGVYAWEPFYEYQLDAVEELTLALIKKYPTIKYIVSHEEIDTRGWKTDPGPMFPMRRFQKLLEDRSLDVAPKPVAAEPDVGKPSTTSFVVPVVFPPPIIQKSPPPLPHIEPTPEPSWWERNSRGTRRLWNLVTGSNR